MFEQLTKPFKKYADLPSEAVILKDADEQEGQASVESDDELEQTQEVK